MLRGCFADFCRTSCGDPLLFKYVQYAFIFGLTWLIVFSFFALSLVVCTLQILLLDLVQENMCFSLSLFSMVGAGAVAR